MTQLSRIRRSLWALLTGGFVYLATAAPAAAQCVMCYVSAAGSGDRGIRALQIGILILMIPTVTIMAGLVYTVIRRRHGVPVGTEKSKTDSAWDEKLAELRVSPDTDGLLPRA